MAARYGRERFVNTLVAAGADVNAVNNSGQLPLDIVIQNHLDGYNIRGTLTILTPKTAFPAEQGEPTGEPMAEHRR